MENINLIIGMVGTIIATCVGVYSVVSYVSKDKKEEIKEDKQDATVEVACNTRLEVKLDYVSKGIDDIKLDHKDMGRQLISINDRLIVVEESTKSAHKRLDKLEGGNQNERSNH